MHVVGRPYVARGTWHVAALRTGAPPFCPFVRSSCPLMYASPPGPPASQAPTDGSVQPLHTCAHTRTHMHTRTRVHVHTLEWAHRPLRASAADTCAFCRWHEPLPRVPPAHLPGLFWLLQGAGGCRTWSVATAADAHSPLRAACVLVTTAVNNAGSVHRTHTQNPKKENTLMCAPASAPAHRPPRVPRCPVKAALGSLPLPRRGFVPPARAAPRASVPRPRPAGLSPGPTHPFSFVSAVTAFPHGCVCSQGVQWLLRALRVSALQGDDDLLC